MNDLPASQEVADRQLIGLDFADAEIKNQVAMFLAFAELHTTLDLNLASVVVGDGTNHQKHAAYVCVNTNKFGLHNEAVSAEGTVPLKLTPLLQAISSVVGRSQREIAHSALNFVGGSANAQSVRQAVSLSLIHI